MALTVAEKKVNILFSMIDDTQKTLNNIERGLDGLDQSVTDTEFSVGKMVQAFLTSEIVLKAWSTTVDIARAGLNYLKESLYAGAELERLNEATVKIGENMGYTSDEIYGLIEGLEDVNTYGSNATIAVRSLLQSGLLPMIEGMQRVDTQTGKTLTGIDAFIIATKDLAANAGISSGDAIDVMTTAIATQNGEMLKQFGIMVDLTELYGANADKLDGLSGEALILRKRQMLLNEVMDQSANFAGVYSATYDTAGKNILSFQDVIKSLQEQLGLGLQPAFKAFTNTTLEAGRGLRDFIMTDEVQNFLTTVSTAIGDFILGFKDGFGTTFDTIKAVFEEMKPAVNDFIESLYDLFGLEGDQRNFGELMGKIGSAVGEFAGIELTGIIKGITLLIEFLTIAINTFISFKNAAVETANNIEAGINKVVFAVQRVREEIEKLKRKIKELANTPIGDALTGGVLDNIPGFAVGIKNVPQDMIAVIHKGEAVIPAKDNPYNPSNVTNNSTTMGNIVINNPVVDSKQRLNDLVNAMQKAVEQKLINQNNAARLGYYNSL